MSDEKYKYVGDPAIRLIEELSEVIHAVCKLERFGWWGHHPDRVTSNLQHLHGEWFDLETAYGEYMKHLVKTHAERRENVRERRKKAVLMEASKERRKNEPERRKATGSG